MKNNKVMTFKGKRDFEAYGKVEDWAKKNGYSIGRMCGDRPVGLKKGKWDIAKWDNLSSEDKKQLDGQVDGKDKRNGTLTVTINILMDTVVKDTNKVTKSKESKMEDRIEMVKTNYKKLVEAGMTADMVDGKMFEITPADSTVDYATVKYDGVEYKVNGTKRLKVTEVKVKTAKAKSEPKPAVTEVECEECGNKFARSKFNPNQTKCPDCRGTKKTVSEPVDKICDVCDNEFTVSKFNKYLTTCPDCKKKARADRVKANKKANKKVEAEYKAGK